MASPSRALTNIGRTRVMQEPGAFGADPSASIASFGDLRVTGATIPSAALDPEMLPDMRMQQNVHERYVDVVGFKKGDGLAIKGSICGSGQTLNAAATPVQTTITKMLQKIVGGYQSDAGSAYGSAATATGVIVTAAQGTRMPAGKLVAIESGSGSNLFCVRKIATQSTDTVTWSIATGLGATPFTMVAGCRVLGSLQIYPTNSPSSSTGLAFVLESEDRAQIFWLTGAQASAFGIEWPLGKDLAWSVTMMAAKLFLDSLGGTIEVAASLSGAAIGAATYDDGARCVGTAGSIWFTPKAGTVLLAPHVSEFTFTPNTKWMDSGASFNGTEGRAFYEYAPDQALATITVPYDPAYQTAMRANTAYQLMAQAGQTAGGIFALELPNVFIRSAKIVDKGGVLRHQLTLACLRDTLGTGDLPGAPWRMGWM